MELAVSPPSVPTGMIKRFGKLGPIYLVGKPTRQIEDGDWMIDILVVESGEETEYPYSCLRDDPEA